jgi:hypothetical protein
MEAAYESNQKPLGRANEGRRTRISEATVARGGEAEMAAEVRAMATRSTPEWNW